MTENKMFVSLHNNAPSFDRAFAVIRAFGKWVKLSASEYEEWVSLHFEPPIIRTWKMKRFMAKHSESEVQE